MHVCGALFGDVIQHHLGVLVVYLLSICGAMLYSVSCNLGGVAGILQTASLPAPLGVAGILQTLV